MAGVWKKTMNYLGLVEDEEEFVEDLPEAEPAPVRRMRPDLLVLEYTEIWPNLIRAAKRSGSRIALTNGRFSPTHIAFQQGNPELGRWLDTFVFYNKLNGKLDELSRKWLGTPLPENLPSL